MTETFYQYECKNCEAEFFAEWLSSTQSSKPYCPSCGKDENTALTGEEIEHG